MNPQLVYAVIARGSNVLSEWSESYGNFTTVTRTLIKKLDNLQVARSHHSDAAWLIQEPAMVSYMYDGRYVFHSYSSPDSPALTFLVLADKTAGVKIPYRFLIELHDEFIATYGTEAPSRALPLAYSEAFAPSMSALMTRYNRMTDHMDLACPELVRIKKQMESIQNVMVENIDSLLARSERVDLLVDKAETIDQNAMQFNRQTRQYRREVWWRNNKLFTALILGGCGIGTLGTSILLGFPFKI